MTVKKKKSSPDYSEWIGGKPKANGEGAASKPSSGLYVVSTPIGNLGDITLRALRTLADADVVLSEDTRVTGALLHSYGIKKPLLSYHDHNAAERQPEVMARLAAGESVALVSDAGTPLISDPGYRLVAACREAGHGVIAIPGASAVLTALVSAGLPTDRFMFAGFLPAKTAARRKELAELGGVDTTLVFYESPARLSASLDDMAEVLGGERAAVVARELTKMFEEIRRATIGELAAHYREQPTPKGEIVIVVGPPLKTAPNAEDIDELLRQALATQTLRDAVAAVAKITGVKKSEVYQRALGLGNEGAC